MRSFDDEKDKIHRGRESGAVIKLQAQRFKEARIAMLTSGETGIFTGYGDRSGHALVFVPRSLAVARVARRRWLLRLWLPVAFGRTRAPRSCACVFSRSTSRRRKGLVLLPRIMFRGSTIPVLCMSSRFCFLAKRGVESWPFVSAFARLQETVIIDRQRRRTIPAANAAMAQRMLAGRPMLLFPEGTTGDGSARPANFTARISPPCAIFSPRRAGSRRFACNLSLSSYSSPAAAWLGDATLLPHLVAPQG